MGFLRRSWHTWRETSQVASNQLELTKCPCFADRPEFLFDANDLSTYIFVGRQLNSLCRQCGTIFAARRPKPEVTDLHYRLFPELEEKNHNSYPPPSRHSKGKIRRAHRLLGVVGDKGLLRPNMSVLHIRARIHG